MRFDVNRLSQLAGIDKGSNRLLSEAGNRSQHEDRNGDESDYRWGKNQLNEDDEYGEDFLSVSDRDNESANPDLDFDDTSEGGARKGDQSKSRLDYEDVDELNDAYFLGEDDEADVEEDIVLEIDEGMLRREIRRMKSERMNENKLRLAVRNEIHDIFDDLGISDSSWVYGNNKPRNSKQGRVNMSFTGPGFW